jgi:hypothetical protein
VTKHRSYWLAIYCKYTVVRHKRTLPRNEDLLVSESLYYHGKKQGSFAPDGYPSISIYKMASGRDGLVRQKNRFVRQKKSWYLKKTGRTSWERKKTTRRLLRSQFPSPSLLALRAPRAPPSRRSLAPPLCPRSAGRHGNYAPPLSKVFASEQEVLREIPEVGGGCRWGGSAVFEGMGGDYFESRNFPDRLFTSPGFEGIIPRYPQKSPPL